MNAGFRHEQAVAVFLRNQVHHAPDLARRGISTMRDLFRDDPNVVHDRRVRGGFAFYLPDLFVGNRKKLRGEAIFWACPTHLT